LVEAVHAVGSWSLRCFSIKLGGRWALNHWAAPLAMGFLDRVFQIEQRSGHTSTQPPRRHAKRSADRPRPQRVRRSYGIASSSASPLTCLLRPVTVRAPAALCKCAPREPSIRHLPRAPFARLASFVGTPHGDVRGER
jgi:hypothetical protein